MALSECPSAASPLQPCPLCGWWSTGHSPEHSTAATPLSPGPGHSPAVCSVTGHRQGQHEGGKTLP